MSIPLKPHVDFRSFIEQLKEDNDLIEIDDEIDPYLEAAAIVRKTCETNGRVPLFNNIKGSRNGLWRMLGAQAALRGNDPNTQFARMARHFGLPPNANLNTIYKKARSGSTETPIPPVVVDRSEAPCKENVTTEIDFHALPCPQLHEHDGGKYVQTFGTNIVHSPDGKWTSWSICRGHVFDKTSLVLLILDFQHIGKIWQMWKDIGQDMPWTLCFGVPPAASMASGQNIPDHISEDEYVGAVCGEPIPVVKSEMFEDMYVPATSEIVFEGYVSTTILSKEGPFGEYPGHLFLTDTHQVPRAFVHTITWRNNAIMPICVPGRATDETHSLVAGMIAAQLQASAEVKNLPVADTHCLFESQATWVVYKIDTRALRQTNVAPEEFRKQMAEFTYFAKAGIQIHRTFMVGPDVNIYDFKDVMWAFATRCRPYVHDHRIEDKEARCFALMPFMGHGYGESQYGGKVLHDCLLPIEYEADPNWIPCDYLHQYPSDVRDRIDARWANWGMALQSVGR